MNENNLPNGWTRAPLGDVATIDSDLVDPVQHSQMPHIAPNHIESGTGRLLPYTTIAEDKVTSPKHRFRVGQILYSKIRPYLAKAVLVDFEGLCSADMYPISTKLEPAYLHRWLISDEFTARVSQDQGRTVLPKVNQAALVKIEVPVPPLAEQRRIVSKLESLLARSRRAKEALDAIPALLERFRQSVLASAFRGDLTADWRAQHPDVEPASKLLERIRAERRRQWEGIELEKMRAKRKVPLNDSWKTKYQEPAPVESLGLPDIPQGWHHAHLEDVAEMALGKMLDRAKHTTGTQLPYLRNLNVRWGSIDFSDLATMPFEDDELERFGLLAGDVLICEGGEPGRAAVWPGEPSNIKFQKAIHRVRPSSALEPWWLVYHLWHDAKLGNLEAHFTGTTIKHFTGVALSHYPMCLPPPAEQREIIKRVGTLFQSATRLLQQSSGGLQKITEFDEAILAKAFRGELVPQDPNDEPASVLLERLRAEREASDGSTPKRSRGRRPAA